MWGQRMCCHHVCWIAWSSLNLLWAAVVAQVNKLINAAIPLGHMGRRWDIAMACLFLARWAAGYGGAMRAALCVAIPTGTADVVCDLSRSCLKGLGHGLPASRSHQLPLSPCCSPAAAFITGHTIVVDGGEWMCRCALAVCLLVALYVCLVAGQLQHPTSRCMLR